MAFRALLVSTVSSSNTFVAFWFNAAEVQCDESSDNRRKAAASDGPRSLRNCLAAGRKFPTGMPRDWTEALIAPASITAFLYCVIGRKSVLGWLSVSLVFAAASLLSREGRAAALSLTAISAYCVAYRLWADERDRLATVSLYLSRPDLDCSILYCHSCASADNMFLLVTAEVLNHSLVKTSLKSATLEVEVDGMCLRSRVSCPIQARESARISGMAASQMRTRNFTDLIAESAEVPLESGLCRTGTLIFSFASMPEIPESVTLRISLEDAFGSIHQAEQIVSGGGGFWS